MKTDRPPAKVTISGKVTQNGLGISTSSSGLIRETTALKMACLPPQVAITSLRSYPAPKSRWYISMIACCRTRVPAAGVYFVCPARIAASAASLMFCGVSKSGSPAPRSTTSTPAARMASAACIAASVDDTFIARTFSET